MEAVVGPCGHMGGRTEPRRVLEKSASQLSMQVVQCNRKSSIAAAMARGRSRFGVGVDEALELAGNDGVLVGWLGGWNFAGHR